MPLSPALLQLLKKPETTAGTSEQTQDRILPALPLLHFHTVIEKPSTFGGKPGPRHRFLNGAALPLIAFSREIQLKQSPEQHNAQLTGDSTQQPSTAACPTRQHPQQFLGALLRAPAEADFISAPSTSHPSRLSPKFRLLSLPLPSPLHSNFCAQHQRAAGSQTSLKTEAPAQGEN